jgi:hypothetical protein
MAGSGVACGQIDLSDSALVIPEGESFIHIKTAALNLAQGTYSINVAFFGINKRTTIIHAVDVGRIEVAGAVPYWCSYKVPVDELKIELVSESDLPDGCEPFK